MANIFLLTTIVIVVSSSVNSERRSFLSYSRNFQKAVPPNWKNDQEEFNRNLVKNSGQPWGEMRVGPHPPPLCPNPHAPWALRSLHAEKESTKTRVNQLKDKLIPNNIIHIKALNQPHPKPKTEFKKSLDNNRHKRDVSQAKNYRTKREVIINPQIKPEMVMQPHLQPVLQEVEKQYQDKIIEKRDKRQILLMINQRPLDLAKKPRTTPNPFIRDTNIADYDLVKPESYKPEVEVVNSMDTDSYQLSETSELDYESDYTISMSDSEDWENYPLTTPSGPNPGWGLPTLADMYQRPKWNRAPHQRVKRSPKQRKRKIGEYKRKLKERRKRKEAKRKRRIIRNSKEDKAVKEEIKEEDIEKFLQKPKIKPRKTVYQQEETSKEVLWSNGTHRIIEDPGAKFEWINRTHFKILKDNATDEWYKQTHVLLYGEEYWANRTKELGTQKPKQTVKEEDPHDDYSEDYDEEFTREEEEERAIKIKKSKKHDNKKEIKEKTIQKQILKNENVEKDSDKKSKIEDNLKIESKSKEKKAKKKKSDNKGQKEKVKKTVKKPDETENVQEKIIKQKNKASEDIGSNLLEKQKINKSEEKVPKNKDKIKKTKRKEKKGKLKSKVKKENISESLEKADSDKNEDKSLLESEIKKKTSEDKTLNKAIKKLQIKSQAKKQIYKKGSGKKSKTKIKKPQ